MDSTGSWLHCFYSLDIDHDCIINDQNVSTTIDSFDRHQLQRWKRTFSAFVRFCFSQTRFAMAPVLTTLTTKTKTTSFGWPKSKVLHARVRHTLPRAFRIKWKVRSHFTFDFPHWDEENDTYVGFSFKEMWTFTWSGYLSCTVTSQ